MQRTFALGLGLLALAAVPATAADISQRMPVKAPMMAPVAYSWSGCYVGAHVGGAFASRDVTATDRDGYNALGDSWGYKLDSNVMGGGTLGCNYQTGQFVFGIEGEGGYLSLRGSATDPLSPFIPLDTVSSARIGDWYGMITGRGGIAFDRTLFYIKGGVAFVDVKTSVIDANPAGGNTISANGGSTRAAWTLGGGIEYALSDAWSLKGEYMYIGIRQSETACGVATAGGATFCWDHSLPGVHTAKIGLNYHFNTAPLMARY